MRLNTSRNVHFLLLTIALYCQLSESANILFSGTFGEGSHFLSQVPIAKSLVQKGHNVTFLINDEFSHRANNPQLSKFFHFEIFSIPNHPGIIKQSLDRLAEVFFGESVGIGELIKRQSAYRLIIGESCRSVLSNGSLMDRLSKIDAIVMDVGWPCGVFVKSYLMRHTNASQIRAVVTTPTTPTPFIFDIAGSPINPAYQPTLMTGLSHQMSFSERVKNTLALTVTRMVGKYVVYQPFTGLQKEFDLDPDLGLSVTLFHKFTDLFLLNTDFATEFPFPLMPNVIAVGGLTSGPAETLDPDLEDFMRSSGDHGVVLFTLGTYFSSFTSSRPEILKTFLDAFSRIPQKIVIQLKEMPQYVLPSNVKALPWLPQNDLLGHHKTRALMFQGGNNGFQEALYHGVPMVVIPFLGDQHDVAARVQSRGLGMVIDKARLSADYIHQVLTEVLENHTFNLTAKRLSAIFRDRPLGPSARAAFWIEHVIKHGGDYMRSPEHELSFIQLHLIDVLVFFIVIAGIMLFVLYRCIRCIHSLVTCCCQGKQMKIKNE